MSVEIPQICAACARESLNPGYGNTFTLRNEGTEDLTLAWRGFHLVLAPGQPFIIPSGPAWLAVAAKWATEEPVTLAHLGSVLIGPRTQDVGVVPITIVNGEYRCSLHIFRELQ